MLRKLVATTAAMLLFSLFQGGTAQPVGICGGGPQTQKPMSVAIGLNTYWLAHAEEFTWELDGPRSLTGSITAQPGAFETSVLVNGLRPGSYTVTMSSQILPPQSGHFDVVPPGCGNAVDFTYIVEPE